MGQCNRKDLQEKLAAALWPDDFPDAAEEIDEHVSTCEECREGLAQLRLLDKLMNAYRNELCDVVSPCPSSEILVDFALGTQVDPSTEAHINACPDCLKQVSLVREITRENLEARHSSPTLEEKALIRRLVDREYGSPDKQASHRGRGFFRTLATWTHFPSLAMGGVAAAILIVVVLLPGTTPKRAHLHPVFSEVQWNVTPVMSQSKRPQTLHSPVVAPDSVAILLFMADKSTLTREYADEIYRKLMPGQVLCASYRFISPKELKERLSGQNVAMSLQDVRERVFDKTDARYLLTFDISSTPTGLSFKGTLFQRNREDAIGGIERTGLPEDTMPTRIHGAAFELLADAEIESLRTRQAPSK